MGRFHQDIVRRHCLASVGALLFSLLFIVHAVTHSTPYLPLLLAVLAFYWVGQAVLFFWIASGRSAAYSDPAMTSIVMTWTVVCLSVALYFCPDCRDLLLLGYLAVLPYGVFRLTWRGFLGLALFTMAAYTSIMLALHQQGKVPWDAGHESILAGAFLISLLGYVVLGREVGVLRNAYRSKNRQLREAMKRIEELAVRDELTGLYNRRFLLSSLDRRQALANREGLPFVLAFVDIDHFKQINDQHGHRIGDEVLEELAGLLSGSVREVDLVARYGGEEFVLLLSGLTLGSAEPALNRIRMAVMEKRFSEACLPLTVSVGVSQYHAGENSDTLINRADRLLYEAKRSGRNRVVTEAVGERSKPVGTHA